jgi:hypothetical protein
MSSDPCHRVLIPPTGHNHHEMTTKDIPYVALIVLFMGVMFFAGRHSVSVSSQVVPAPIPTTSVVATISTPRPVADQVVEHERVLPVEALPSVATVEALAEKGLTKAVTKATDAKPPTTPSAVATVPPMKIELDDDPTAVANPYKVPKMVASTPGF